MEQNHLLAHFNCPPNRFDDYIPYNLWQSQLLISQLQQDKEALDGRLRMREAELDALQRRQIITRVLRKIKQILKTFNP